MALLTAADVQRLLAAHELHPRRSLGQNFVVDANTVRKVVRDAGVSAGDLVVEVGPGLGSLTLALREVGARVVAVEVDPRMVAALRSVVGHDPDVAVVQGDAVTEDYRALTGGGPAALVANLPYNVATPVLLRALASEAFGRLLVMTQREVGVRWAAGVGDALYGAVSVKVAAHASAQVAARVSRNAFHPVPNVDSVTVRLSPRPWERPVPRPALLALVDAGFAQRRKRLRNALGAAGWSPATVETALRDAGLATGARAEELDLDAWVRLLGALELRGR